LGGGGNGSNIDLAAGAIDFRLGHPPDSEVVSLSHLTCPNCRFTVAASAAASPFQNCPRCLLRDNTAVMMIAAKAPRRFGRRAGDMDKIAEAKARLSGPARGASSV
jgi:hypothetical protein